MTKSVGADGLPLCQELVHTGWELYLQEFSDVLHKGPSQTEITEHCLDTGLAAPIQLPPQVASCILPDSVRGAETNGAGWHRCTPQVNGLCPLS